MNAVNAVLVFILVWSFSAVCQENDDDGNISCENVSGTVGKEVTFKCSISKPYNEICIKMYKFQYPKSYSDSEICKEPPKNTCDHRNSFTCLYTPTKAMKEEFRLFVQASSGMFTQKFTVDIAEQSSIILKESDDTGSKDTVISSAVGCSVIVILIIILMIIICKKQPFEFQKRMFICIKHNDDNSNCPDNVI